MTITSEPARHDASRNLAALWTPALLWHPRFMGDGATTPLIPALFWLTERLRPRRVLALNTGDGAALFAVCQALDKAADATSGARVTGWGRWSDQATGRALTAVPDRLLRHAEQLYPTLLRLEIGDAPAPGPASDRPDLMLITLDAEAGADADTLAAQIGDWRAGLADGGLLVLIGAPGGLTAQMRAGLWLDVGAGLALFGAGDDLPAAVADLAADAQDGHAADAIRWMFRQFGAVAETARHAAIQERRAGTLADKARAAGKELAQLRQSWDARGLELARAQAALYAAENPHPRLAELAAELDAARAEQDHVAAQVAQERQTRFFETSALTAELERIRAQADSAAAEAQAQAHKQLTQAQAQTRKQLAEAQSAHQRDSKASSSTIATLTSEIAALKKRLADQERALSAYKAEVLASTSWRLTAPVRAVGKMLRRR
ncbi:MAG: hypothetical protein Q4G14_00725 [Paracoccus sp. (in: a-proteobacteria)]|uniref:hypothetical protein n=1 Tax=Paracoccus sp. TaxID=267 RepID=UPI0026DEE4E0|nr:hypothetical protein [Paracoccus sp. (in: a-proteobacteria)]MDO5611751.1 hypothetical protein [Paracoccus sp. (in: a-proteobacteria)]